MAERNPKTISNILLARWDDPSINSGQVSELIVTWDEFRKTDWVSEIEYPELILQQTQQLLSI